MSADSGSDLGSPQSVAGGVELGGSEQADAAVDETLELDVPRREPWWSHLAALMERSDGSR